MKLFKKIYFNVVPTNNIKKRTSPTTTLTTFGQSGFAAAASTIVYNSVGSFLATRTASSTINGGYFTDTWVASAEL